MAEQVYLAIDLGASGGRVFAGRFDGSRLALDELHRFEHGGIQAGGGLYWNSLGLWQQIVEGLRAAHARYGAAIRSIGVDTWGVDYGLLDARDELLGQPRCYRDRRTTGVMQRVLEQVPREEVFRQTGVQFMGINTLYQLVAMRQQRSPQLDMAKTFLMMPDLINWLLTGVKSCEATNASTTQCFNPTTHDWARDLLGKLDIPTEMFLPVTEPGSRLGKLRPEVADETGLADVEVVAPGTHDTASAVVAVPAASKPGARPDWCYISSGTWSLMGVETPGPVLTDACLRWNFTNEGGVGRTIRLLKNITGLWLAQECRRVWRQKGKNLSWDELTRLAEAAPALASVIDPDAAEFQAPGDMPEAVRAYCRRTGQAVPTDEGGVFRACLEGIAHRYRYVLGALESLTEGRIETIHVVGGGTQNKQLCQATADACQRPVVAGPVEATVIGNVMVQAMSAGAVGSVAEAREVVGRSFALEHYAPRASAPWDAAYERFLKVAVR
ncbi:MAG: rhamnulokinase [Planctomycetes bacterium]|nr:rhamnulokinase [Planctomycetota bacterium]